MVPTETPVPPPPSGNTGSLTTDADLEEAAKERRKLSRGFLIGEPIL